MSLLDVRFWQPTHPALKPYEIAPTCCICQRETHTHDELRECVKAYRAQS